MLQVTQYEIIKTNKLTVFSREYQYFNKKQQQNDFTEVIDNPIFRIYGENRSMQKVARCTIKISGTS
jgi:hypothetical protein